MARKNKLTEERKEKIISFIRAGNYATQAAQAAGVSESTFYRWLAKGKDAGVLCEKWEEDVETWNDMTDRQRRLNPQAKPDTNKAPTPDDILFWEFWEAVKKSEAEAEASAVLHIKKAANEGTWQAAAWYLERKYKDRWSRQDKVSHEGTINHALGLNASEEEIEQTKKRLRQARALTEGGLEITETEIIEVEVVEEEDE